jgi:hypothetical protein
MTDLSESKNCGLAELMNFLGVAYQNALAHDAGNNDTPSEDLTAMDFGLERAAIQLSSRILLAMTDRSCGSNAGNNIPDATASDSSADCVSITNKEEDAELQHLTDTLSYAAYKLQSLATSARAEDSADQTDGRTREFTAGNDPAAARAISGEWSSRLRSMEHLYRMSFALANAHLDQSQQVTYLEAARQQLLLAHKSLENERQFCAHNSCLDSPNPPRYQFAQEREALEQGLDRLEQDLKDVRTTTP